MVTHWLVGASALLLLVAAAQAAPNDVLVKASPAAFQARIPDGWVRLPPATGNSRFKVTSPPGTPFAECAVIIKEMPALRGMDQASIDLEMAAKVPSKQEIASQYGLGMNNFVAEGARVGSIGKMTAHVIHMQLSMGAAPNERWSSAMLTNAYSAKGLGWSVSCSGGGKSAAEARQAYLHWHKEIEAFPTFVKPQ